MSNTVETVLAPLAPHEQPATAADPAPRIEAVDGLRGFAALIVLVFHIYGNAGAPPLRVAHGINVLRPLHDGWAGVNFFLVLSGFCLYWPFVTKPDRRLRVRSYAVRRIWRIVPTYYFSLAFISLLALLWPLYRANTTYAFPKGPLDAGLHLLLLHSLTAGTMHSWNDVSWSLGLEWTWYMVFPLTLLLYRKIGASAGLLCLTAINVVYRVALYWHFYPDTLSVDENLAWRTFILGRLFEFGAGMWVAWQIRHTAFSSRLLRGVPLAVLLILAVSHALTPVPTFLPVRDVLYGAASALLLLAATAPTDNVVRRIFSPRWLCWVGLFSYTLYLFHLPMVTGLRVTLERFGWHGLPLFFTLLACGVPVVLLCWAIFHLVERPFLSVKPSTVKKVLA